MLKFIKLCELILVVLALALLIATLAMLIAGRRVGLIGGWHATV
jgi:hypothetical protein